jgi:predicted extracellular nuclease
MRAPAMNFRPDDMGHLIAITLVAAHAGGRRSYRIQPGDGNPDTSDGIFAYQGSTWTNPRGIRPGVIVSVSGTITKLFGTTEFAHRQTDSLKVTAISECMAAAGPSSPPGRMLWSTGYIWNNLGEKAQVRDPPAVIE